MIDKIILYMRKSSGFSQEELSKKVGLAASTISGYEINNSNPNFCTVKKIADACDFDIVFIDRNNSEQITFENIVVKSKKR